MNDSKNQYITGPLANSATIKIVLSWMSLFILIGMGFLMLVFLGEGLRMQFFIMGLSTLPILFALELNRRNSTQIAGIIVAIVLTIMITILATFGQGIYDIAVMTYPAILIVASLILRRNTTIYLTIFIIICMGWLIFGNVYGIYQPLFPAQSYPRQIYITSTILIITAVSVQYLSETIRNNAIIISYQLDERKKAEQALLKAEELYRNMVEKTSVIIYRNTAERESKTLYISPQIEDFLGFSQREWLENPYFWVSLIHPDDLRGVFANIEVNLESGTKGVSEYRTLSKSGQWVWFQDEAIVVKNGSGEAQYIHGVLIDITEQKQAETKIKQREAILSAVAQTAQLLLRSTDWRNESNTILKLLGEATGASHVYIFENHPDMNGIMLSSQTYEWTALGVKSELGNPAYQNSRLNPTSPGLEDWYTNLSGGIPFYGSGKEYPRFWKRVFGEQGLKTLLDMPIIVNDQWWGIIGFDDFLDEMPWSQAEIDALMAAAGNLGTVIARQQSDVALRASEEKFQLVFHKTFVPMLVSRAKDRVIIDANLAFSQGTGYSREEVLGRTGVELNLWVNPADQILQQQILEQQEYTTEFKAGFRRKSGEVGVALVSVVSIHLGEEHCYIYTLYDISKIDELLNELKTKNEELQSFTYTVSHDLRAPLITISGFLGYLEQDAKKGNIERVQRDALRINEAVARMQRLLSELLELSRIGRLMNPPEDVPFGEIVEEALKVVQGRLTTQQVEVQADTDFPSVHGDRVRLVEVIQNLVDNATKFMGRQENPKIEIGVKNETNRPVFFVRDNGIGILPDQHERVFGLFNKLDANTEGTGIGLSLVKRIVEVHGGKIWIESDGKGNGTTFYFTLLPLAHNKVPHEQKTALH